MAAMRAEIYEYLPQCAKEIRQDVFIEEQGFQNELTISPYISFCLTRPTGLWPPAAYSGMIPWTPTYWGGWPWPGNAAERI